MLSMKKLSECGVKIIGGQIMTRVTANTEKGDEVIETRKVLVPKCIHSDGTITAEDICKAIEEPVSIIVESIKQTLEQTPPELSSDIYDSGIMLTGGGALLRGFDRLISERTGINVRVAKRPLESVCAGILRIIQSEERAAHLLQYRDR